MVLLGWFVFVLWVLLGLWLTMWAFLFLPTGPGAVHDGNNGAWRRGVCAWLLALPLAQLAHQF